MLALSTDAVRADLHRTIAALATRAELSAAVAPLATREELGTLREDFEKFRKSSQESVELVAGHLAGISLKVDSLLAR